MCTNHQQHKNNTDYIALPICFLIIASILRKSSYTRYVQRIYALYIAGIADNE
ncbi:hypothetical protein PEC301879_41180 [Pectobacterium carotovorum subsp. carotovorum]|nr:hypothetical protein PEC301879_41180 [Pectobacterium carotovorum subsp. carotovorum]